MATFTNKKVWHSNLKFASPLVVQFTSDLMDSKYDEDQRIVFFKVRGDPTDGYYLVIENDTIADRISKLGKSRDWFKVTATGQSESADIAIQTANVTTDDKSSSQSYGAETIFENYVTCLNAADEAIKASDLPSKIKGALRAESLSSIAASLFIQWDRKQYLVPLTPSMLEPETPDVVEVDDDDGQAPSDDDDESSSGDDLPF